MGKSSKQTLIQVTMAVSSLGLLGWLLSSSLAPKDEWTHDSYVVIKEDLLSRIAKNHKYTSRLPASAREDLAKCAVDHAKGAIKPSQFAALYSDHKSTASRLFLDCAKTVHAHVVAQNKALHIPGIAGRQVAASQVALRVPVAEVQNQEFNPEDMWGTQQRDEGKNLMLSFVARQGQIDPSNTQETRQEVASCMLNKASSQFSPVHLRAVAQAKDGLISQWFADCAEDNGMTIAAQQDLPDSQPSRQISSLNPDPSQQAAPVSAMKTLDGEGLGADGT